jgi:hypothetical protein
MTTSRQKVYGQPVIASLKDSAVMETRTLRMPDGTPVICRRRAMLDGSGMRWTAEVSLEVAIEIHAPD